MDRFLSVVLFVIATSSVIRAMGECPHPNLNTPAERNVYRVAAVVINGLVALAAYKLW
jgi:hypothetical protein